MQRIILLALCAIVAWSTTNNSQAQSARKLEELIERNRQGSQPQSKALPDNTVVLGKGSGDLEWDFPLRREQWLNSDPLMAESLRGKGIVMLFFEEQCPNCAKRWPDVLSLSQQYANKPVLFIAVNSGNDPRTVSNYVRQARITWPVIVDFDRSFESTMGVRTISLDNVIQVRYVSSDGAARPGKWSDIPATVEAALEGASWRVEPLGMPKELRNAWREIEFGDYAAAARDVNKYAKSKKENQKSAAASLLAAVNEAMEADLDKVRDDLRDQKHWESYKGLKLVEQRYKGYEVPEVVDNKIKELAKRDDVRDEIDAKKTLDKALSTAAKNSASAKRKAKNLLEKLVKNSPNTEAASKAQDLLAGTR